MMPSDADACLYARYKNGKLELIMCIYVDEILISTTKNETLKGANENLRNRFDMQNMGSVK